MKPFEELLTASAQTHGHLCPGQVVRDGREVVIGHLSLCKPCAEGAYFTNAREVSWQDINWSPEQRLAFPSAAVALN
jgi:hypothetical protein